ncbi:hypothetical protein HMSSN036_48080 [Paenibacillus macerans]|nr:hypothetical protein HMSSN036_48080 [Paenibacillus macerans]
MQNSDQNCRYLRVAPAGPIIVAQLLAARLSLVDSPGSSPDGFPDWPSGLPLRINSLVPLLLSRCTRRSFSPLPPHYQGFGE